MYNALLNRRWHIFRVVDEDDVWAMVSETASIWSPIIAACLSPILLASFTFSTLTFGFLNFAFTRIDVRIICCGRHLGAAGTSGDLRDFLLLLKELQLYQELILFGIQCIPELPIAP